LLSKARVRRLFERRRLRPACWRSIPAACSSSTGSFSGAVRSSAASNSEVPIVPVWLKPDNKILDLSPQIFSAVELISRSSLLPLNAVLVAGSLRTLSIELPYLQT